MLVLSRKQQESIVIDVNVTITVLRIKGNKVQIGIDAPGNVHVVRGELRSNVTADRPSRDQQNKCSAILDRESETSDARSVRARPLRRFLRAGRCQCTSLMPSPLPETRR